MLTETMMDNFDITAHLERKNGPIGSDSWKKAEDKAWEEYNGELIRAAEEESSETR